MENIIREIKNTKILNPEILEEINTIRNNLSDMEDIEIISYGPTGPNGPPVGPICCIPPPLGGSVPC